MKNQINLGRSLAIAGAFTLLALSVPLVAMLFTNEIKWDFMDFVVMGGLLFSVGAAYVLLTQSSSGTFRMAMLVALAAIFLMTWGNLAVGLIGSGPNVANLMYLFVVVVFLIGTIRSRFRAGAMERVMYATGFATCLLTLIVLLLGIQDRPGTSLKEILGVNGLLVLLFLVSALMFRLAARQGRAKPLSHG